MNQDQYKDGLKLIEKIIGFKRPITLEEEALLLKTMDEVEEYEKKHFPIPLPSEEEL